MRKRIGNKHILGATFLSAIAIGSLGYSHCQIPCDIYNDQMRFDMIAEHIATIGKSMKQITELSGQDKPNLNQIVRWIQNKDQHAGELSEIVTYYFMAQRIKLSAEGDKDEYNEYIKKLTLLHKMLIYSMQSKQTTDLDNVNKLRSLLDEFHKVYFHEAE